MAQDNAFLGTGWCFPPGFSDASGEIEMVSGETDIEQSIHILLSTTPGERTLLPEYGCGIKRMVFDEINQSTVTKITYLISQALLYFEPRINVNSIEVIVDFALEGRLDIVIDYVVISTNARRNMVYPFYIMEGTLVEL